ncbi:probable MFS monosaccharide transporter [Rhynchosporium secalis]|uniref:Probable MFS monosaccharide transporter n=1 Tax=Rhynchosporium secalis TaxID=38038 RepID=A0A1E1M3C0_RHYSE|nr:probable MFS monosaccharide transporter [Rhynchosporium secalis]
MLGKSGNFFGLRGVRLQIAVGLLAGLDFLLFGYDQGVTGGLLTLDSFRSQFPGIDPLQSGISATESSNRSTYQGITVASYNVGCFLGAIMCIWISNPLGRRKTIFLGTAIMVIGAILQASSYSIAQFIIGRIVTGIGNGLNTSTVPVWQSECSRSHRRGQLVMIEGALITGGIMIAYWLDFGFYFLDPNPVAWRFPLAFQIVFCIPILAFVMTLPESPRWLVLRNKDEQAMHVLSALNDQPVDSDYVRSEFAAIKDTVLEMQKGTFKDLFTMGPDRHFHRTVLAYFNQVMQQVTGINLITYYIPNVLEQQVGLSPTLAKLIAACNGTEYFLASWVAVFTVERFGRRQLMLFGAAGMSLSMVALSICDAIGSAAGIGQTVFLFVFNTFFAVGWLGMTWLYPAEIVPLKIRAPANALSTSGNWLFNFMVVMITPVAFSSIGYKTYVIFAVINASIFPVVYFFYPETAYRSLEEMDSIFLKTKSIFSTVKTAKDEPRRFDKNGDLLINYEETEEHKRWNGEAKVENRETVVH